MASPDEALPRLTEIHEVVDQVSRFDTLRHAAGHAICAAELLKADLAERLRDLNGQAEFLRDSPVQLATPEAIEYYGRGPKRKVAKSEDEPIIVEGLFKRFTLFDRAELSEIGELQWPWENEATARIEICFVLSPGAQNGRARGIKTTTAVPVSKYEQINVLDLKPTDL